MDSEIDKKQTHVTDPSLANLNRTGRPKGSLSKTNADARAALGLYVESNVWRLQEWLDMIAHGYEIKEIETGEDGKTKETTRRIAPNPHRAYELFMSVIEYHVPKLTRTEVKATVNHNGDYELRSQTAEEAAREYRDLIQ